MADSRIRKRPKKIREDSGHEKPTKEEIAIAKHLRFKLPTRKTTYRQENVEYFTGSKAVNFLLDSKWATGKKGTEVLFTTRSSVVIYLNRLIQKRMFYRMKKTVKRKREKESKSKDKDIKDKESKQNEKELKKKDKEKDSKLKEKDSKKKDAESNEKKVKKQEKKKGEDKVEEEENEKDTKKGKKKVILEEPDQLSFKDDSYAYVWVYDPIKPSHYFLGFILVIAAIGICIYPLWPPEIRIGTYYLGLVGAGIVGSILVLGVFRFILFAFLWAATIGKLNFWLFPNLFEDVGPKESFQPFYTKEWRSEDEKDDDHKEDKDSEKDDNNKEEEEGVETQEENDDEKESDTKNEGCEKSESASEENSVSEGEGEETAGQLDFEVIGKDEISAVEE